jgi:hypothetical protein
MVILSRCRSHRCGRQRLDAFSQRPWRLKPCAIRHRAAGANARQGTEINRPVGDNNADARHFLDDGSCNDLVGPKNLMHEICKMNK